LESEDLKWKKPEFMPAIAQVFKAHKAPFSLDKDRRLLAAGCVATIATGDEFGFSEKSEKLRFSFVLDPLNLVSLFPIVLAVLKQLTNKGAVPEWQFKLKKPGADVVRQDFKIAARLKDKPVEFGNKGKFRFRDVQFKTGVFHPDKPFVGLQLCSQKVTVVDVVDLFLLLEESAVIVRSDSLFEL
jgi:hypothetical protein